MSITLRAGLFICFMALGLGGSATAYAQQCIGGASLNGYYGLLVGGNSLTANSAGKYLSGAVHFNAKCGLTASNLYGGINGNFSNTTATGTYNTNSDGTILLTLNLSDGSAAQTYLIGVSPSTTEAGGIETDGSATATIHLIPQKNNHPLYTNSSLVGTFSIVCSGEAAYKDDLNLVAFDGQGNLAGANPFNVDGFIGDSPYTGTYTVNLDGTITGVLLNAYSQFTFSGVIDNGATEVEYTYVQAGTGGIVACSGKK